MIFIANPSACTSGSAALRCKAQPVDSPIKCVPANIAALVFEKSVSAQGLGAPPLKSRQVAVPPAHPLFGQSKRASRLKRSPSGQLLGWSSGASQRQEAHFFTNQKTRTDDMDEIMQAFLKPVKKGRAHRLRLPDGGACADGRSALQRFERYLAP